MEQLEELERKLRGIIQLNRELKHELVVLRAEAVQLKQERAQLELSLLHEASAVLKLTEEKSAIKNTIDDLLSSIASLEATER